MHERSVPHITVKPPFETDEEGIAEVERVLRSITHGEKAVPFTLKGFGRIGFKTAYIDVYKSPEATALVRRLLKALNEHLPSLPVFPHEGKKLHASIARFMDRKRARRVMRYLKEEHPEFGMLFDNVAILKKTGRVWSVATVVSLKKEAPQWMLAEAPDEILAR